MIKVVRPVRPVLERDVKLEIRRWAAKQPDVVLFNNPQGLLAINGRTVHAGIGKGSADLIGSVTMPIPLAGSANGGYLVARSLAVEVKRPGGGVLARHQQRWLEYVKSKGWIVGVCSSLEQFVALIEAARRWEV